MKVRLNKKTQGELSANPALGTLQTKQKQVEENIIACIDEPFLKPENIRHGITMAGVDGKYAEVKYLNIYNVEGNHLRTLASTEPNPSIGLTGDSIYLTNKPFENQVAYNICADCFNCTCHIRRDHPLDSGLPQSFNTGSVSFGPNTKQVDLVIAEGTISHDEAFVNISTPNEAVIPYYVELPKDLLTGANYKFDLDRGSRMWVFKDADAQVFGEIASRFIEAGCVSDNTSSEFVGNVLCHTFKSLSQTFIVQKLEFKYDSLPSDDQKAANHSEVRLIEESRTGEFNSEAYSATGQVIMEPTSTNSSYSNALIMVSDNAGTPSEWLTPDNKRYAGLSGFIFRLNDGSFFIIDSGIGGEETDYNHLTDAFMKALEAYAPDPQNIHVRGWLITHMHTDHMGVLLDIANDPSLASRFRIDKMLYQEPGRDLTATSANKVKPYNIPAFRAAVKALQPGEVVRVHVGQKYTFRDLNLTIVGAVSTLLGSTHPTTGEIVKDVIGFNNTSVVSLVDFKGKKMLFLGDAENIMNKAVVNPLLSGAIELHTINGVQVAHHGYGTSHSISSGNVVYELLDYLEFVFWPVAYEHYSGKHVDGTPYYEEEGVKWKALTEVAVNAALEDKRHIYPVNNFSMVCTNFDTWEFEPVDFVEDANEEIVGYCWYCDAPVYDMMNSIDPGSTGLHFYCDKHYPNWCENGHLYLEDTCPECSPKCWHCTNTAVSSIELNSSTYVYYCADHYPDYCTEHQTYGLASEGWTCSECEAALIECPECHNKIQSGFDGTPYCQDCYNKIYNGGGEDTPHDYCAHCGDGIYGAEYKYCDKCGMICSDCTECGNCYVSACGADTRSKCIMCSRYYCSSHSSGQNDGKCQQCKGIEFS